MATTVNISGLPRAHHAPPQFSYRPPQDSPATPFPLILQRRATKAVRAHVQRAVARCGVLLVADAALLYAARLAVRGIGDAAWLGSTVASLTRELVPRGTYPALELLCAMALGLAVLGNYGTGDHRRDPSSLLAGCTLGLGLSFWATLWSQFSIWMLVGFVLTAATVGGLLIAERVAIDALVRRVRGHGGQPARAVVIGTAPDARRAMGNPALSDQSETNVLGYLDVGVTPARDALGGVLDLVRVIQEQRIDTVVLSGPLKDQLFTRLIYVAEAAGCRVFSLPRSFGLGEFEPQLVWRGGEPLVQITRPGRLGGHLLAKRIIDLGVSISVLVVLAPVLALIALAVRASSRGPILFRQVRVGRGGRTFEILKFRSMVRDAEARRPGLADQSVYGDGRLFKMVNDPRVTRVGAFLRRTSLDELPQLWNVVRGDMSLVGPRPPMPSEVALYEEHHYTRFDMKPGITGPWQVSGRNKITDFEEVVRIETAHMRRWSIWKDFAILLRTVPVVLKMDGAH